jgi:hypothetical protein
VNFIFWKLHFLLIVLCVMAFQASATSCITTKKVVEEQSTEYRQKIKIEVSKNGTEFIVYVFMPDAINDKKFDNVYFFKGISQFDATKDDYDFFMPLRTYKDEEGRLFTLYTIKEGLTEQNTIGLTYGEGCGMALEYQIDYTNSY